MGCILSYIIGATGIPKIREIDRTGVMGDMNPFPFISLLLNNVCWLTYSLMGIRDYWVFASNAPGFIMSCYCILVCHRYASTQLKNAMELALFGVVAASLVLVLFAGVVYPVDITNPAANATRNRVLGFLADSALVIFYASPLAAVKKVIDEKDASSIHWPLALASMVNSVLWTVFGLAVKDYFIMAPNFFGVAFASFQLFLILVFKDSKKNRKKSKIIQVNNNVVLVMERSESQSLLQNTSHQLEIPAMGSDYEQYDNIADYLAHDDKRSKKKHELKRQNSNPCIVNIGNDNDDDTNSDSAPSYNSGDNDKYSNYSHRDLTNRSINSESYYHIDRRPKRTNTFGSDFDCYKHYQVSNSRMSKASLNQFGQLHMKRHRSNNAVIRI